MDPQTIYVTQIAYWRRPCWANFKLLQQYSPAALELHFRIPLTNYPHSKNLDPVYQDAFAKFKFAREQAEVDPVVECLRNFEGTFNNQKTIAKLIAKKRKSNLINFFYGFLPHNSRIESLERSLLALLDSYYMQVIYLQIQSADGYISPEVQIAVTQCKTQIIYAFSDLRQAIINSKLRGENAQMVLNFLDAALHKMDPEHYVAPRMALRRG